jgi:ATP-binding cassette subfamily A (ABC1) protein 3
MRACEVAGKRERHLRITAEDATGWVLRSALERDGAIELTAFATWWAGEDDAERLDAFVMASLPSARMLERRGNHVSYRVMELGGMKLGEVFALVESNKQALCIAEYAVSQTTLEQIFVSFASQNDDDVVRGVVAGRE